MHREFGYRTGAALLLLMVGIFSYACFGAESAETVRAGTYNIEHFMKMFDQIMMPERSRETTELYDDEEDLYEVKRVITLPDFDPDILAIEECCNEEMLKYFNEKWLGGKYAYVKVFKGNTDGQFLGILAKKGFKALDVREYYQEKDPTNGRPLFSRGPGFVLFQTPGGHKLWAGCTHIKSKYGNSQNVTEWRIREMKRTREICGELMAEGKADGIVMMGDFNDDFGMDKYEHTLRTDAVAVMLEGKEMAKLVCADEPLWKDKPQVSTYHCEIKPAKYRSFIDHIFVNPKLAGDIERVAVIDDPIAAVASDHYPVLCVLKLPAGN